MHRTAFTKRYFSTFHKTYVAKASSYTICPANSPGVVSLFGPGGGLSLFTLVSSPSSLLLYIKTKKQYMYTRKFLLNLSFYSCIHYTILPSHIHTIYSCIHE